MNFNFEEFQNGLTLEMNKHIQNDLIKRQKEEDEHLLNIKNEKNKQDEINKKQIEDDIKQKELTIKKEHDDEIKRNVENALEIQKQQIIRDNGYEIMQLTNNFYYAHINQINIDFENEKKEHEENKRILAYTTKTFNRTYNKECISCDLKALAISYNS